MGTASVSVRRGSTEAIGHAKGTQAAVALDCADGRRILGISEDGCAVRFSVPGQRCAIGNAATTARKATALVLLNLIDRNPAAVLRLLGGGTVSSGPAGAA